MTHELKQIIQSYLNGKKQGLRSILATVVALNGSSYRVAILYILIELFSLDTKALAAFASAIKARTSIQVSSYYRKADARNSGFGSTMLLQNKSYVVNAEAQFNPAPVP